MEYYFGIPDGHTPPATPPPSNGYSTGSLSKPRPAQRLRSSYVDLPVGDHTDKKRLEYIGKVTKTFQQLTSHQKHVFLSELLNYCDNQLLAYVHDIIEPKLKIDFLKELPIELSLHVLSFIDNPKDLANAVRVSPFWNSLLKDEATWKSLCTRHRYRRRSSLIEAGSARRRHNQQHPQNHVSYRDYFWRRYNTEMAWAQGTGKLIQCENDIDRALVTCLQMDDCYTVVGSDNQMIEVFNTETGEHLRTLHGHEGGVWALQFARTGNENKRILVSGGCDRVVLVWDLDSGQLIHSMHGHISTVRCLKIHGSSKLAATGSRDASLRIWDIEHGMIRHVCTGHQASVRCLDVHGDLVATGSYDATARLWDINTGECLHVYTGHHSQIYSIAFDGVRIVTGSLDWSIRVWSPTFGNCLALLTGHTALVGHLQLTTPYESSPLLVSGGSDGCLRIWDLNHYECRHRISAHDNSVSCLQVDHKRIISGGSDGQVKLWDLETGMLIRLFSEPARTVWKLGFTDINAVVVLQKPARSTVAMDPVLDQPEHIETVIELHKFDNYHAV
ncbi:hypothetical protein K492DRAFT_224118 [Lichtheimia hyalospora FSU 10163]|nr:hypothetical protein K492DRAFT_224118 [Lichtheimia hyalospora FSU 10163]